MKKVLLIILSILFYFFITYITNTLNIFFQNTNLLLSSLFIIVVFSYHFGNRDIALIGYFLFTLVFLFYREKVDVNLNLDFYLFAWLKSIFKNKIVMINIIGNLFLFVPYVFLLKQKYFLVIIIGLILGLEIIQYLSKRGVLDIVDITLNLFGVIVALPFRWRFYER